MLLVGHCKVLWFYLAPFLRYGDLLARNCLFFLPLSCSVPSLYMLPFEFCGEVKREETRVMGLSSSEDPIIVAGVVLTQCERVTDKRTERRTDLVQLIQRSAKRSVKITGLCDTFR